MRTRLLALGDRELIAKDQYLGVLPPRFAPRQAQQRQDPGNNEDDQLQAHKPTIIARPTKRRLPSAARHAHLLQAAVGAQRRVAEGRGSPVEEHRVNALHPGGVLGPQVVIQLEQRRALQDARRRDPALREPALGP